MDEDESTKISYSTISNGHSISVILSPDSCAGGCTGSFDNSFYYDFSNVPALDRMFYPISSSLDDTSTYRLSWFGYITKYQQEYTSEGQRPALKH